MFGDTNERDNHLLLFLFISALLISSSVFIGVINTSHLDKKSYYEKEKIKSSGSRNNNAPIWWLQETADEIAGTIENSPNTDNITITDNGLSLSFSSFIWEQDDWSGGPGRSNQVINESYFWSSDGVNYQDDPQNLSMVYTPYWSAKQSLLQSRADHGSVWDPVNNQVIVWGGYNTGGRERLIKTVEYYNPTTDQWSWGTSSDVGRQSPTVAWDSTRGKMFAFGGTDGSVEEYKEAWYFRPSKGSGGTWTPLPDCPSTMKNGEGAYDPNNDIIVCHGRSYWRITIYDPSTNTWSEGSDEYGFRDHAGGTWLPEQSLFMIVNGAQYSNPRKPQTIFYAPTNDSWCPGPDEPSYRRRPTLVWDDTHEMAILFGGDKPDPEYENTNETWIYNPKNGIWKQVQAPNAPALYAHCAVWDSVNCQMIVTGGSGTAGLASNVWSLKFIYDDVSWLESSSIDTGGMAGISEILCDYKCNLEGSNAGAIKIQLASGNELRPTDFVGPDGTPNSYYTDWGVLDDKTHTENRYLRYKLFFNTCNDVVSPVLDSVSIEYYQYKSEGQMESAIFDTGIDGPCWIYPAWNEDVPEDTSIMVSFRTSNNSDMSSPTAWKDIEEGTTHRNDVFRRYFQYRVEMASPSSCYTPTMGDISFGFNGIPVLDLPQSTPKEGNFSTEFKFSVRYRDSDGTPPVRASIIIDGAPGNMMITSNGSSSSGFEYAFRTTLDSGIHEYAFLFNDTYSEVRLPSYGFFAGAWVDGTPSLSNPTVSPPEGASDMFFTFTVEYDDPEKLAPTQKYVFVDDIQYNMVEDQMLSSTTRLYKYTTKLSEGLHTYSFQFSDGEYDVLSPSSGVFEGPTVVDPPTIIDHYPKRDSHDVPTDIKLLIKFSESVDPATVNPLTVFIQDMEETRVSSSVTYYESNRTAVIKPQSILDGNCSYTVTVTDQIADILGNRMENDFVWTFTTEEETPDNIQDEDDDNEPEISDTDPLDTDVRKDDRSTGFVVLVIIIPLLLVVVLGIVIFVIFRRKRKDESHQDELMYPHQHQLNPPVQPYNRYPAQNKQMMGQQSMNTHLQAHGQDAVQQRFYYHNTTPIVEARPLNPYYQAQTQQDHQRQQGTNFPPPPP